MSDTPGQELMPRPERRPELRAGADIRPIIPTTVEEAFRLAQAIVGAGLAPDSYDNNPQKILIGILKAAEVGLPPITGLASIAIIHNRACIWGDGAMALVQRTGLVEKVEYGCEHAPTTPDDKDPLPSDFRDNCTAFYRIWRKGQENPYEGRFSVRDAKRAHLWGSTKKPWVEYPTRMLLARARAFALREGFADALAGLSIAEEIQDLPPEAPAKTDTGFLDDTPRVSGPLDQPIGEDARRLEARWRAAANQIPAEGHYSPDSAGGDLNSPSPPAQPIPTDAAVASAACDVAPDRGINRDDPLKPGELGGMGEP